MQKRRGKIPENFLAMILPVISQQWIKFDEPASYAVKLNQT